MQRNFSLEQLAHASQEIKSRGRIRTAVEDFIVDEQLGFSATGEGEHVLVQVRKKLENTEHVARELARFADVPRKAVSYAGLKDRHAITTQYFSIHLPGLITPDWSALNNEHMEILSSQRHQKKLKRGALVCNSFKLRVRQFNGDRELTERRLQNIIATGVPNYFMLQRFGFDYHNLHAADDILTGGRRIKDRFRRNIYLSAARSWLFNLVLSKRIETGTWNRAVDGDSLMLDRSRACFHIERVDEEISRRIASLEIHPTAALWGKGDDMVSGEALAIQQAVLAEWSGWLEGLVASRQEMARRSLRVSLPDLEWEWVDNESLQLSFTLPPGSYATAVLREILEFEDVARIARPAAKR